MSQKFLVAINIAFVSKDSLISNHFHSKGWKVWHWQVDLWLLAGVPFDVKPVDIWDELRSLPGLQNLSGFVCGMDEQPVFWGNNPPDSWAWMRENWGIVDPSGIDRSRRPQEV